jgi:head-tail adaptor
VKIAAGRLDRRVSVLRPTTSINAIGESVEIFAEAGKRWVALLSLSPAEVEREQTPGSRASTKLLMRLDSLTRQIGVRWRVTLDGVVYNVIGTDATPRDGSVMLLLAGVQA